MTVFADTSALFALVAPDDLHAPEADRLWQSFTRTDPTLVSTNYVWLEALTLLQRRSGMGAARAFLQNVAPLIQWIWVDREVHDAAVDRLLQIDHRGVSLVDCASFEVMQREGIDRVFAFDPHFAEFGFTLLA